jgi:hypothetical protein
MRKSSIIWAHACGAFKESTTGVARRLLVREWAKTSAFGLHQSARLGVSVLRDPE